MHKKTILVTGAAGFIGSTLCARLLRSGHRVIGVDAFTDYYDVRNKERNVQPLLLNTDFSLHRIDSAEVATISSHLEQVEHLIHLAAQPGVRSSWGQDFEVYTRNNITATQRLLEFARTHLSLASFVYASSSSVYGNAETYPTSEKTRPQPYSPYGVSKLAGEHLASLYATNFGVPTRSLRFFTVYGPRQRPDMAFTRFLSRIAKDEPLTIFGDGSQVREFTYVDDIVEAITASAFTPLKDGVVMNVSGGSTVSLRQVLETLEGELGLNFSVQYEPAIAGDVYRTGGTTELVSTLTGWEPRVSLADGLARQWDWAQSLSDSKS